MTVARIFAVLTLVAALAPQAGAVSSSIWTLKDPQAFSSGEMKNLSMSSKGQIRLNSEFKKIEAEGAESLALWSSAIDSKGVVYFGTGTGAAIYRLKGDKLERIKLDDKYTTDIIVTCIAADSRDNIYAALLPSGRIIRISPNGVVAEFAILSELYIWDICIDPKGALYVATGPAGRLYRITEDGKKIDRLYDSDEDHIFSVALGKDGTLYFGTSQNAILFKLPPEEMKKDAPRPTVIYDFPGTDIRAIYARQDDIFLVVNNTDQAEEAYDYFSEMPDSPDEEVTLEYQTGGYTRGTVYRMDKNGNLETVINTEGLIANIRGEGGSMFIATVGQNLVYKYDIVKKEMSSFQIDEPQALTFEIFKGHLAAIGTSGPGVVYKVGAKPAEEGMYTSRVFDAGNPCKWGTIQYRASGKLAVQTRTGFTETPDSTWSDWSEAADGKAVQIKSPKGRFIQFHLIWREKKSALNEISLSYMVANLRPSIQSIMVGPAESNEYDSFHPDMPTMEGARPDGSGILGGQNLQVKWDALDPNDDLMEFNIYYKEAREKRWKMLNHNGPTRLLSWPIRPGLFPSGRYRVKIVASDKPGNPDGNALECEMISEEFIIDNTPPALSGLKAATARNITKISGLAVEETTRVTGIEYAIDGAMWKSSMPQDKIFDSPREELAIILEDLEPGEHTIVVRASDGNGNSSTAHLVFEVPKP
jgi:sugar lactone lactonase YvrE